MFYMQPNKCILFTETMKNNTIYSPTSKVRSNIYLKDILKALRDIPVIYYE